MLATGFGVQTGVNKTMVRESQRCAASDQNADGNLPGLQPQQPIELQNASKNNPSAQLQPKYTQ